ncbi:receptor-transporting protein 3-like [Aplochiton taeniatus]
MSTQDWTRIFQQKIRELNRGDSWFMDFDDTIVPNAQGYNWHQYIRSAFARRGWASNQVIVVFHMYLQTTERRGTVKVRRFRQNCKQCHGAPMEEANISTDNIDVLLEKLVEKIGIKCYGEKPAERNRFFNNEEVDGPHEAAHCEACRYGICNKK